MGVGNSLMQAIIGDAEEQGFWTLQSGIFPENAASVRLHEKFGFRTVGRRERIGQMRDGRWRDIILMERRSQTVGK
jgi:phosphinothricin acetyltransferase